jgi:F0F1-type ATP synthase assembly protein I
MTKFQYISIAILTVVFAFLAIKIMNATGGNIVGTVIGLILGMAAMVFIMEKKKKKGNKD